MNIPKDMIVNSVQHRYAGNAWAVVQVFDGEWSRITSAVGGKQKGRNQFFLVWSKLLEIESPIKPERLSELQAIRSDLESGKKVVQNTYLVPA